MRILETDLLDILLACVNNKLKNKLKNIKIRWSAKSACCVVLASSGYPGKYKIGKPISGLKNIKNPDTIVFHAGTKNSKGKLVTNGGRVFGVTSTGSSLNEALSKSYKAIKTISFQGMQYRKDIGRRK